MSVKGGLFGGGQNQQVEEEEERREYWRVNRIDMCIYVCAEIFTYVLVI
jgi:hypothetical protein